MIVKLLTEHHLEFLGLIKEEAQTRLSLHLSNVKLLEVSCRGSIYVGSQEDVAAECQSGRFTILKFLL